LLVRRDGHQILLPGDLDRLAFQEMVMAESPEISPSPDSPRGIEEIMIAWKERAAKSRQENFIFLLSLKYRSPEKVDQLARRLHEKAFSILHCSQCANCCKTVGPKLSAEDIARIAGHLGVSEIAFSDK
jgi:hypothetical protein